MLRYVLSNLLGLIGAAVGGVVGFYLFGWIAGQGFLAPFVPGGILGLGCAALAAHRSLARGIVCGVAGLILGFYADWCNFQWKDPSLTWYVTHLQDLPMVKLIAIPIGGLLAFWLGRDEFGVVRLDLLPGGKPSSDQGSAAARES
jgi:hypothetical protein